MRRTQVLFLSALVLAVACTTVQAQAQTLLPTGTTPIMVAPGLSTCTQTSLMSGTCIIRIQTDTAPFGYFLTDHYWPQLDLANSITMNPIDDAFYCPVPVSWAVTAYPSIGGGLSQGPGQQFSMSCLGTNLHSVKATITVVVHAFNYTYAKPCGGRVRTMCTYTNLWFNDGTIATVVPGT